MSYVRFLLDRRLTSTVTRSSPYLHLDRRRRQEGSTHRFSKPQEHHLTTWRGRQGDFLSPSGRHTDPDMHEGGEILNDCGAKRASRIVVPTTCVAFTERDARCLRPAGWRS